MLKRILLTGIQTSTYRWKQPKCQSTDEWMNELGYICTYICVYNRSYSDIKVDEVLMYSTMQKTSEMRELDTKDPVFYDSIYIKYPEKMSP